MLDVKAGLNRRDFNWRVIRHLCLMLKVCDDNIKKNYR
jgi:hypothetical protein